MLAEPQAQHAWLQKLVGDWTYESECPIGPGGAAMKAQGKETVRPLGGLWIVAEGNGEMPGGGPATTLLTIGYDPAKGRFTGTWVGSMMTHLWVYEGELDASGRVLTLSCDGPSMKGDGSTAKYQDIVEIVSDDHRIFTGRVQGDDGQWATMMTAHHRRKK